MSVSFKSPATSENLNQAFLDKNEDTETSFKVTLSRGASGATVDDVQQSINNNASNLSNHIDDFTAHIKYDTKANLDTWALTADNGARAFATDEKTAYQVVDGLLVEFGGGGGIAEWVTLGGYDIGDVVWLAADNKIYRCTVANNDAAFTPANWQELSENPLEGFVSVNAQDNVIVTDSNDTIVIDNEKGVLYRTRFKEILPSALFADVGNVTTSDKTVSPFYGGLTAIIEQASASVDDGTGFIIDFTFANREIDWQNRSLKILIKNKAVGNDGDYRFKVSLSNGSYREVSSSAIKSGVNFTEIVITTNSDDVALKIEALVVTPNDSATLEIGEISVVDDFLVLGSVYNASEWKSFPMVIQGSISNPAKATSPAVDQAFWRRVGDSMEIHYTYQHDSATGASAGSGYYKFMLPSGYSIETSKMGTVVLYNSIGSSICFGTSVAVQTGSAVYRGATDHIALLVGDETVGATEVGSAFLPLTTAAIRYSFKAVVPIQGWKAYTDAVVSEDASNLNSDIRVDGFNSFSGNVYTFSTVTRNVSSDITYNAANGTFTVNAGGAGLYHMALQTNPDTLGISAAISKNETAISYTSSTLAVQEASAAADQVNIYASEFLKEGDVIRALTNGGGINVASRVWFSIKKETKRNINFGGNNGDYFTAEHKTGQKWIDGRDVYRQVIVVNSNITATSTITTLVTGLEPINALNYSAGGAYLLMGFIQTDVNRSYVFYNPSTGVLGAQIDGTPFIVAAGTKIIFEYVKP